MPLCILRQLIGSMHVDLRSRAVLWQLSYAVVVRNHSADLLDRKDFVTMQGRAFPRVAYLKECGNSHAAAWCGKRVLGGGRLSRNRPFIIGGTSATAVVAGRDTIDKYLLASEGTLKRRLRARKYAIL